MVLVAVALGLSFGVELISGTRLPWAVRPAMGLAVMILVAQLFVSADATAELAIPIVVGLGAFGLAMGWSAGLFKGPVPVWGIGAALGVYLVYGAPVLLIGRADLGGLHQARRHRQPGWRSAITPSSSVAAWRGFEPSTWEALIEINISTGYPIGSFVPMALIGTVTGQDVAWTVQPSMAVLAAMLALLLYEYLRSLISGAAVRAVVAFLGAQSAMLLGYTLWGGMKEVTAAVLLALGPLVAWAAIEQRGARWPWVLPGLVAAAFVGVLGPGGAVWILLTMGPLLAEAWRRLGRAAALSLAWRAAALALVVTVPQIVTPNGIFDPFQAFLFEETELGNLAGPLSIQHVMGVWPARDFRLDPDFKTGVTVLAIALAGLAWFAVYTAYRDRRPPLPAYVVGGVAAFALVYALGSPWIDGKGMAIISPALLTAGLAGAVLLVQRTSRNIEGWLLGALTAGLILYTSFLFYQGAFLAPREEHRELERIGEEFEGRGPALVTEGSIYGPRHFLRRLDAENAKDLRRRPVTLTDGGLPDDVPFLDTDAIATEGLEPYNLLVIRRSPVSSRPPGDFRLVEAGKYYEVWERTGSSGSGGAPLERLPLGEPPLESAAVPDCEAVAALAAGAGPGGTLLAARPADKFVIDLATASAPESWTVDEASRVIPDSSGELEAEIEVLSAGEYTVWVGGNILGELEVSVGDETAPPRRQALNQNLYEPFGPFELDVGPQTIALSYSDSRLHPGAGSDPSPLGPIIVERVQPGDRGTVSLEPSQYRRLCGESWDWIEAYG